MVEKCILLSCVDCWRLRLGGTHNFMYEIEMNVKILSNRKVDDVNHG